MAHDLHFEPKIDFNCITETIALVREGDLQKNKFKIIDHTAHLLGGVNAFLADKFDHDEPDHPIIGDVAAAEADAMSIEELCDKVEQEVQNVQPNTSGQLDAEGNHVEQPEGFGDEARGLNPVLAAFLRKLLEMVLDSLLK